MTSLAASLAFVPPMMPALVDSAPEGEAWIHEIKYDGYRTQLVVDRGEAAAYTRRGHDWSHLYAAILSAARGLGCAGARIDGEVIVQDANGLSDFQALRSSLARRRPDGLVFMAFDLLHLGDRDLRREPVEDRRARLRELLGDNRPTSILQYSDHVVGGGPAFFALADKAGLEGVVSKKLGSRYRSGPTRSWLKTKAFAEEEFVVVGATKGDLAPVALLARETEDRRLEYAGGAMVSFSEAERELFWRATERLAIPDPPLHIEARTETTWLEPEMRVRVRHLRGEERLRHATVKSLAWVPPPPGPASSPGRRREPEPARAPSREPSHFRAAEAIPDRDALLDYYRRIAPLLLAFAGGRPLNLFRCPPHRAGQCVFQRNRNHPPTRADLFGKAIRSVPVLQKNGRTEEYLWVKDEEGVLDCVRADAIEFHGWGSRVGDIERPDRIAIDLDPDEGLGFGEVRRTALEVRARLADLGLESFPLLTGGKGIHVVVPLRPEAEWETVRGFARAFCTAMAEAEPERFTVAIAKARRKGRIFLDYLRNQRTATAILPWSARARPGAPVAAPLGWDELEGIDRPDLFGIGDIAALKRRGRSRKLTGWGVADQILPAGWE